MAWTLQALRVTAAAAAAAVAVAVLCPICSLEMLASCLVTLIAHAMTSCMKGHLCPQGGSGPAQHDLAAVAWFSVRAGQPLVAWGTVLAALRAPWAAGASPVLPACTHEHASVTRRLEIHLSQQSLLATLSLCMLCSILQLTSNFLASVRAACADIACSSQLTSKHVCRPDRVGHDNRAAHQSGPAAQGVAASWAGGSTAVGSAAGEPAGTALSSAFEAGRGRLRGPHCAVAGLPRPLFRAQPLGGTHCIAAS